MFRSTVVSTPELLARSGTRLSGTQRWFEASSSKTSECCDSSFSSFSWSSRSSSRYPYSLDVFSTQNMRDPAECLKMYNGYMTKKLTLSDTTKKQENDAKANDMFEDMANFLSESKDKRERDLVLTMSQTIRQLSQQMKEWKDIKDGLQSFQGTTADWQNMERDIKILKEAVQGISTAQEKWQSEVTNCQESYFKTLGKIHDGFDEMKNSIENLNDKINKMSGNTKNGMSVTAMKCIRCRNLKPYKVLKTTKRLINAPSTSKGTEEPAKDMSESETNSGEGIFKRTRNKLRILDHVWKSDSSKPMQDPSTDKRNSAENASQFSKQLSAQGKPLSRKSDAETMSETDDTPSTPFRVNQNLSDPHKIQIEYVSHASHMHEFFA